LVRAFLAKIGATEADLLCGPHRPLSDAVAKDYETRGVRLTAVHSNCSGKHTGMLALARHHGWPTADYTRPDHPVQQRCLEEVSRWTDLPADRIGRGTDGCSVVTFALPLRNMALGWARLNNAEFGMRNAELKATPGSAEFGKGSAESKTAGGLRIPHSALRIVQAMLAHPEILAGPGRPCTEIMRAHPGRVIAKVGAEGVYAALLLREGWGVALKVEDGHSQAAVLAIAAVLEQLGLAPQPASLGPRPVTNWRGTVVGELRVRGEITR
jgi:L-asparaginase II